MEGLFQKQVGNLLEPACPVAEEWVRKLRAGQVVTVSAKSVRNYRFLQKGFVLLRVAFDMWEPGELEHNGMPVVKHFERFRELLSIMAGHYEQVWNLDGTFTLQARSWSFAKCEEEDFEALYRNILTITWDKIFRKASFSSEAEVEQMVATLLRFE